MKQTSKNYNNIIAVLSFSMNVFFISHSVHGPVRISLTALTSGHEFVCPNETVNFLCTVMNTSALIWESDEYIGPGENERISFDAEFDRPGVGKTIDWKPTFAQLVDVQCPGSDYQMCDITSDLQISVFSESDVNIECKSDTVSEPISVAYSGGSFICLFC